MSEERRNLAEVSSALVYWAVMGAGTTVFLFVAVPLRALSALLRGPRSWLGRRHPVR
jgi:hypothetical protein